MNTCKRCLKSFHHKPVDNGCCSFSCKEIVILQCRFCKCKIKRLAKHSYPVCYSCQRKRLRVSYQYRKGGQIDIEAIQG